MDGWTDGQMDRWTDGQMDRWTDGGMDGGMDGLTSALSLSQVFAEQGRGLMPK